MDREVEEIDQRLRGREHVFGKDTKTTDTGFCWRCEGSKERGTLPTDCPRQRIPKPLKDAIQVGRLDFLGETWEYAKSPWADKATKE